MHLLFRAKWKHADPKVRLEAVARLKDVETLHTLARTDPDPDVRRAAVGQIEDQDILAELAKGPGDVAVAALDRLFEQPLIFQVARQGESPDVRCRAVDRLTDPVAIQRISAEDTHAAVRRHAKARLAGPNNMWEFLKTALAKLEVAESKARQAAEVCADLDGVCAALARDTRFRIHGVVGDVAGPVANGTANVVELLANNVDDAGASAAMKLSRYFQIEIQRTGENAFGLKVSERESTGPFAAARR